MNLIFQFSQAKYSSHYFLYPQELVWNCVSMGCFLCLTVSFRQRESHYNHFESQREPTSHGLKSADLACLSYLKQDIAIGWADFIS